MKFGKRLILLIMSLSFLVLYVSCSGVEETSANEKTEVEQTAHRQKYVGIYNLSEIDYFTDHKMGLFKAAEYLDVDVEYLSSVGSDEVAMKTYFDRAIEEKVDGIVLLGTAESCVEQIERAAAVGISTVLVEGDIPNSERVGVVSTNNFEAGQIGGKYVARELKGSGQIGILTQLNTNVHKDRLAGYEAVFEKYPNIEVVSVKDTKCNYEESVAAVHEMLKEHPEIDIIAATDYYGGPAIMIALSEMEREDIKIVSMDKSKVTTDGISAGRISATLVQQTALMSFYAVRLLYDLKNANIAIDWEEMRFQEEAPVYIYTGVKVQTRDNINE